jgi:hypothetical protein
MYTVGQKICLWQEVVTNSQVLILKEVLVTITETKTGVLGQWSRKPVSGISLRGIGDDCKVYEKHWEYWPESQTNCFTGEWSMRDDGEGVGVAKYWTPKEAVHAYSELKYANKALKMNLVRVDLQGNPIVPKGDVGYCAEHDMYHHVWDTCFSCFMEARKSSQAA